MILLKIDERDMEMVGGFTKFIEEIFLNRNWDLFLTLVLKVNKKRLFELINSGILKGASKKLDIIIEVENISKELNEVSIMNGIRIYNSESYQNFETIHIDHNNYSVIDNFLANKLEFEKQKGLIPTIVQDLNKQVLMLAYSSRKSLQYTLKTKKATYFSRSRNCLWVKGEKSGNYQNVKRIYHDCDVDTLLFIVKQEGFACHNGAYSCFQTEKFSIDYLYELICERVQKYGINESYSKRLAENRDLLMEKIQEESSELINFIDRDNLIWEIADLTYFVLVLMVVMKINPSEITNELRRRNK